MTKYYTSVNDSKYEAEITGPDKVSVNGETFDFEYKFLNNNVLILRINNKNFFIDISESDDEDLFDIGLNGLIYKTECKSELDLMIEKLTKNKGDSKLKKEINSPMPGIIVRMNVSEGQKIKKGDVMLVLEAMKMENEIKAIKDCVIKKINVGERSSVEKNELLITLE